jgi:ribose 5-phosphate isomerase B
MNVLVMGSRIIGYALAFDIAQAYLGATFQKNEERFLRRLNKMKAIERRYLREV